MFSLRVFISILDELFITSNAHFKVKNNSCTFFSVKEFNFLSFNELISFFKFFKPLEISDLNNSLVFSLSSQNLNAISLINSSKSFLLSNFHGFVF
jgi:hypothetical protein